MSDAENICADPCKVAADDLVTRALQISRGTGRAFTLQEKTRFGDRVHLVSIHVEADEAASLLPEARRDGEVLHA